MFFHGISIILIFAATLTGSHPASESNGSLPTFGELLKQHKIQLTEPALVDALKNADPEVRYLAAQKLAEDKATGAIPAIKDALAAEKVPRTRINIAFALAQLGDAAGFDALKDNCRDRNQAAGIRAFSAQYMLGLNSDSTICLSAVLDILEDGSHGDKIQAASLLPQFHNLSPEDLEKVFADLVRALHDPYSLVRLEAGRALADLGDIRAIPELQEAIAREQELAARPQLEQDLRALQEKSRQ